MGIIRGLLLSLIIVNVIVLYYLGSREAVLIHIFKEEIVIFSNIGYI